MWVESKIDGLAALVASELPEGIKEAKLSHSKTGKGFHYDIFEGDCFLMPGHAKLDAVLISEGAEYKVSVVFYDDKEIDELIRQVREHYANMYQKNESSREKNEQDGTFEQLRKYYEEHKENLIKNIKDAHKLKDKYEQQNYIFAKLRKTGPEEQVSGEERSRLKPLLTCLLSSLPELSHPFREREYYLKQISCF